MAVTARSTADADHPAHHHPPLGKNVHPSASQPAAAPGPPGPPSPRARRALSRMPGLPRSLLLPLLTSCPSSCPSSFWIWSGPSSAEPPWWASPPRALQHQQRKSQYKNQQRALFSLLHCNFVRGTAGNVQIPRRSAALSGRRGGGGRRGTHAWIREGGRMVDGCAGEAWMVDGQPAGGAQWAGHRGLTHRALMPCFPERRPAASHPAAISKSVIHGGRKEGGGGGRGGGPGWAWAVPGAACSPPPWPPLPAPRAAWRRPWSPCQCACRGRFSAGTLPSPAVPATPRASARSAPAVRTPAVRASATTPRRRKHLGPAGGQRHGKAVDISGVPPLPPLPPLACHHRFHERKPDSKMCPF